MSYIYIHHICILTYDFSLIALTGHLRPCLQTSWKRHYFTSYKVCHHFFNFRLWHFCWYYLSFFSCHSAKCAIPPSLDRVWNIWRTFTFEQSAFRTSAHTGLKNISCHTRLQAAEAPHESSVLRGETKNNYSAANTACNPLKPHEAGQS